MSKYDVKLPLGWLRKQIAECVAMLNTLPANVREALKHPNNKNS